MVGLLKVGASVTAALQDASNLPLVTRAVSLEVKTITTCLGQLQYFLDGTRTASQSRMSLVLADEVRVVLAECVTHFSELMEILDKLGVRQQARIPRGVQRLKWASKRYILNSLGLPFEDTQVHGRYFTNSRITPSSDSASVSASEAEKSSAELRELVLRSLENDQVMAQRLDEIQAQTASYAEAQSTNGTSAVQSDQAGDNDDVTIRPINESDTDAHSQASRRGSFSGFTFEKDLRITRVYSRIWKRLSSTSLPSSTGRTRGWSVLSDLDLSMVSNISVLSLPIIVSGLYIEENFSLDSSVHSKKTGISKRQATLYEDVDYSNQRIGELADNFDTATIRELMERQRHAEEMRPRFNQIFNSASSNTSYKLHKTEQGDNDAIQSTRKSLDGAIANTKAESSDGKGNLERPLSDISLPDPLDLMMFPERGPERPEEFEGAKPWDTFRFLQRRLFCSPQDPTATGL
ncbi:MAG: hypothetical protein Q9195_007325 [Heterodermia aff. obscurata]